MGKPDRLTTQQREFANALIEGHKQQVAYHRAYPRSALSGSALRVEASRVARNPKVRAYVDAALAEERREVLLTRDKKRQILGSIALDKSAPKQARIMAVKTDNEMTGDNAPVRVEGEITLFAIFAALTKTTGLPAPDETKTLADVAGANIRSQPHAENNA